MEYPVPLPWQQWSRGTGIPWRGFSHLSSIMLLLPYCEKLWEEHEIPNFPNFHGAKSFVHMYKFMLCYTQESQNDSLSEA